MVSSQTWLEQLTLAKLHRLAVLVGSPCSGTKAVRISGIQKALEHSHVSSTNTNNNDGLKVVSIDMGIRNLAYAFLQSAKLTQTMTTSTSKTLRLVAWRRLSIGEDKRTITSHSHEENVTASTTIPKTDGKAVPESFEPIEYATHSYKFIKDIVEKHDPTHILIERQRFRSGGNSAVLEWTIRVGVFEGMLYAVLRTLLAEGKTKCAVVPILPTRVNRFWLEKDSPKPLSSNSGKVLSKAVKMMKVNIVEQLLERPNVEGLQLVFTTEAEQVKNGFLSKRNKDRIGRTKGSQDLLKLDDLSDCLLQGLAWISWQENCNKLRTAGEKAFDL